MAAGESLASVHTDTGGWWGTGVAYVWMRGRCAGGCGALVTGQRQDSLKTKAYSSHVGCGSCKQHLRLKKILENSFEGGVISESPFSLFMSRWTETWCFSNNDVDTHGFFLIWPYQCMHHYCQMWTGCMCYIIWYWSLYHDWMDFLLPIFKQTQMDFGNTMMEKLDIRFPCLIHTLIQNIFCD